MTIRADIQSLTPGTVVVMYVLEFGAETLRFHAGVNELGASVVWKGNAYTRMPIEADGFEWKSGGTLPRPRVRVANMTGLLSALVKANDDLVGAKFTRQRTLLKYLDAVNFAGGVNPTADSNAALPDEVYFVDRKAAEGPVFIEFELAAAIDVAGVQLPRRQMVQNLCTWRYKSSECGYAGGPVATKNDVATAVPADDVCGKRLSSCKLRFGATSQLPFGGFPGVGLIR